VFDTRLEVLGRFPALERWLGPLGASGPVLPVAEQPAVLQRAAEAGLVHSVSNSQQGLWYICNCCTCSCGVLRGMADLGIANVIARSAFVNRVDDLLCTACGLCVESCQFEALSLEDTVRIDEIRCVGCGVCVSVCPEGALSLGLWTRLVILETSEDEFRKEPPKHLIEIINAPTPPDIYINILRGMAEETPFRIKIINLETRKKRSRLGHCPGIRMDMLTEGALSLTRDENAEMQNNARALLAILQDVDSVHVTSPSGSDFTFSVIPLFILHCPPFALIVWP